MNKSQTRLAGVTFDNRQDTMRTVKATDPVLIVRQPDNQYDPNAIAVQTLDKKDLGFFPKELARSVSIYMDKNQLTIMPGVILNQVGDYPLFNLDIGYLGE